MEKEKKPIFTKKHYIKIAEIIERQNKENILNDLIVDLANMFYMDNEAFNTKKFLKACEHIYQFKQITFKESDLINITLGLKPTKPQED